MMRSRFQQKLTEAGCDEAGRGCLAGPVFAAAVILPVRFHLPFLNDSKKLSAQQRDQLRPMIQEQALAWSVASAGLEEIDQLNILNASILAMHKAISQLSLLPELLLIDGNRFKRYNNIEYKCIIEGDSRFASIAAASVLAKTYRDEHMCRLHAEFPQYDWEQNKGYGTCKHREAIKKFGISPHHRKSFRLLPVNSDL